jgi:hypothetical protein
MKRFGFFSKLNLVGLAFLFAAGVPALAEEANSDPAAKMMTNMVARSLARKYNLQPPSNLPKQKMDKETMKLFRSHSTEMLLANPKAMAMRMKVLGEKEPTPAQVQKMAEFMAPIYREATDLVIADCEKKLEKADDKTRSKIEGNLEKLKQGSAETVKNLDRWKKGGFKPGEFSSIPTPFFAKPMGGKYSESSLSFWDQYVKMFIEAFQLDAGQCTMVNSIVNDAKTKAKAYREEHKTEFSEISKATKELWKSRASEQEKNKTYAELKKKYAKLEKPLSDMFVDLKQRLMAVTTEDQRKSAQETLGK